MPQLINTTDQPIKATTGHIVEPDSELSVSQDTLERLASEPYIARCVRKGQLLIEHAGEAGPQKATTREAIAKMKRAELLDVILAHYDDATEADFEGITVEDRDGEDGLRTIAARLTFTDL